MERLTLTFDGRQLAFEPDDTVLDALLRNGQRPAGVLCTTGDCPNCLVTIDSVSYIRSCQTPATSRASIERHGADEAPSLPGAPDAGESDVPMRYATAEVVVIGGGRSGRIAAAEHTAAGRDVIVLEASDGSEAIGVYDGPRVVARTPDGMLSVDCAEIVIATGSSELQPIVPGSELPGVMTAGAAAHFAERGIDPGRVATVGSDVVRFEGGDTVEAVIVGGDPGQERIEADTVVVDLGRYPRNALARMGADLPITIVGSAAMEPALPACPDEGIVCPCSNVTVGQLDGVWERGFREMELLKRATLAGTGTCQGSVCTPYLRSYVATRGSELQPAFTARPVARQLTIAEAGAGEFLPASPRTALDAVHRSLGATMDRIGGWWRPWTYGDTDTEYQAVRTAVSLGDVSTLGKMVIAGPTAEATVQRLYPTDVRTIRDGRCRYALMLNERGYVFDDGMICRESADRFTLTFTTGGANLAEMWVRDCSDSWGHDVRIINQTYSLGAINVTGPLAARLLERAGAGDLPSFLGHADMEVAGIPCKVMRLSFTGELSYELHHPADRSVELWQTLMDLGEDLGVMPHGLEALLRLRLDKGHILVGQDTDYDSTPLRLHHGWAVKMDSDEFIGRHALTRTDAIPLDKMLVGLTTEDAAPLEGAVIWDGDVYAGYVTSAAWSPAVGKGVALGWLDYRNGELPHRVSIEGLEATRVDLPFYDPEGGRSRA